VRLSEIISARVIHPYENFGEATVGSPDPHNADPLRSISSPLLDTA